MSDTMQKLATNLPTMHVRGDEVLLRGEWRLLAFQDHLDELEQQLDRHSSRIDTLHWNLTAMGMLDSTGALVLWRHWGERLPKQIQLTDSQRLHFDMLAASEPPTQTKKERQFQSRRRLARYQKAKRATDNIVDHIRSIISLLGQLVLDTFYLMAQPARIPLREISSTIYHAGVKALFIVGLVGFLIGVVISYLTAIQLKPFGADAFIVNLVGIAVLRELGPMIAAILVAGRSGSAMTAELGVMRVTEELDALRALGVSLTVRLIFPKVVALAIAMPLLVLWADIMGMFGGMLAAGQTLDLNLMQFLEAVPKAVPLPNLWLGLIKGVVFGLVIALTSSHFGLRVQPNSTSLATETTKSVVVAITMVLLVDAVFAIIFMHVGIV